MEDSEYLELWRKRKVEFDVFFAVCPPPAEPVRLSACETVTDHDTFVSSHLSMISANMGHRRFEPYMRRLSIYKKLLTPA